MNNDEIAAIKLLIHEIVEEHKQREMKKVIMVLKVLSGGFFVGMSPQVIPGLIKVLEALQ